MLSMLNVMKLTKVKRQRQTPRLTGVSTRSDTHLYDLLVRVAGTVFVVMGQHLSQQLDVDVHLLQSVHPLCNLLHPSLILTTARHDRMLIRNNRRAVRKVNLPHPNRSGASPLSPCFWLICWPLEGLLGFYSGGARQAAAQRTTISLQVNRRLRKEHL